MTQTPSAVRNDQIVTGYFGKNQEATAQVYAMMEQELDLAGAQPGGREVSIQHCTGDYGCWIYEPHYHLMMEGRREEK